MRWFFTNAHPLREALPPIGETTVGGDADTQLGHPDMRWLRELVAEHTPTCPPSAHPITHALRMAVKRGTLTMDQGLPGRYPLARVLRALSTPPLDVVVLTPLEQPRHGFGTQPVLGWKNQRLNRGVVVGIGSDPGTLTAAASGQWRPCSCQPSHVNVYVTEDAATARKSAQDRRTVLYRPDDAAGSGRALVAAVKHAMSQNYQAGKGAKVWGLD